MMRCPDRQKRGFSLIEMMVAVALFAVVMLIGVGALLSMVDADRKAQSLKSVINNLNFAMESMVRNMRTGTNYHCNVSPNPPSPQALSLPHDCAGGGALIAFESQLGDPNDPTDQIVYRYVDSRLERSVNAGQTFIPVTATEVSIEDLTFFAVGTRSTDTLQPRISVILSGHAKVSDRTESFFTLQSSATQRILDVDAIDRAQSVRCTSLTIDDPVTFAGDVTAIRWTSTGAVSGVVQDSLGGIIATPRSPETDSGDRALRAPPTSRDYIATFTAADGSTDECRTSITII